MLRDFIIEEENVPSFRAALMAVGDSLAVAASVDGQFVFLETKVIDQSWIVMWDDYVANNDYPPENRSGVQRRREAIFPFLGQPILHGGLNMNDSC
jgi:hypothetical protein